MRTAPGGLAASDSTTPLSISARIAPSIGRSTVHHQSDSGLRSSRESIGGPNGQRSVPLVAHGGFQGVNAALNFGNCLKRSHKTAVMPRGRACEKIAGNVGMMVHGNSG